MNRIATFNFDGATLRTTTISGEPWFVAADVLAVLTLDRKALERLDEDEKGVSSIHTLGGEQQVTIVNESGLYSLILGSRKPEAKRFKKWVTGDVLPAIRKTGHYGPAVDPMQVLNDPAAMRGLLLGYSEKVLALESTVAAQATKVAALDRFATFADGSMCITNAAKSLQQQPKAFFRWLQEHQWIFRRPGGSGWIAYQSRIQVGYLEHKVTTVERGDGSEKVVEQVLVTPKGLSKLAMVFVAETSAAA